jgi:pimeloyl-ACP methyl ester carboxylesterase
MPHASLNGIRVHYETAGTGDPVLLVSGLGSPAIGWALQVAALSARHLVITFDNRGVGETELSPDPVYSTGQLADDAAALLGHLGVSRAHVVGASMGGTIAQELAIRHPKLVRSLVLACTWARGDARFLATIEAWVALAHRVPVDERFRHVLYPLIFSPAFYATKGAVEAALQRTLGYAHPTKPDAIERQGRGIVQWNGSRVKRLASVKVPALVLAGADDILTPPAFGRALARALPRGRFQVLPGGHAFFLEQAEVFNAAVLRFLRGVRTP